MILDTGEFLAFGLYFGLLGFLARRQNTDTRQRACATTWMSLEFVLFIVFTVLFFTMGADGFPYTIFGALYLLSLIVATVMTIQMRETLEMLS